MLLILGDRPTSSLNKTSSLSLSSLKQPKPNSPASAHLTPRAAKKKRAPMKEQAAAASATWWRTSSSAAAAAANKTPSPPPPPPPPLLSLRALPPRPSATPPAPASKTPPWPAPRPSPAAPRATRPGRAPRDSRAACGARKGTSRLVVKGAAGTGLSGPRRPGLARACSVRRCGAGGGAASTGGAARLARRG